MFHYSYIDYPKEINIVYDCMTIPIAFYIYKKLLSFGIPQEIIYHIGKYNACLTRNEIILQLKRTNRSKYSVSTSNKEGLVFKTSIKKIYNSVNKEIEAFISVYEWRPSQYNCLKRAHDKPRDWCNSCNGDYECECQYKLKKLTFYTL